MSLDDLSRPALELIRYVAKSKTFKVNRKVKGICKGEHKKYLQELEEAGLIERTGYGKFRVTDQGKKHEYKVLSCEDCGATFYSVIQAESSSSMRCGHSNLSKSMIGFQEDMEAYN